MGEKKNIRIAVIQLNNCQGDREKGMQVAEKLISSAASEGAKLVALPELSACGYIPNDDAWNHGERADGPTSRWARELAARYSVYIGAGFLECDGIDFYNSYLLASPSGVIEGIVRKKNPEAYCYKAGEGEITINTDIGKIGIGVCADNHMKAFFDRMRSEKPDLLLMPHAWATPWKTSKAISEMDMAGAKRDVETLGQIYSDHLGIPVAFINAVGPLPHMSGFLGRLMSPEYYRLQGGSAIFSPGREPSRCGFDKEDFLTADVELNGGKGSGAEPAVYDGWLHPGSKLVRRIIIPMSIFFGRRYYGKSETRKIKAGRLTG